MSLDAKLKKGSVNTQEALICLSIAKLCAKRDERDRFNLDRGECFLFVMYWIERGSTYSKVLP